MTVRVYVVLSQNGGWRLILISIFKHSSTFGVLGQYFQECYIVTGLRRILKKY